MNLRPPADDDADRFYNKGKYAAEVKKKPAKTVVFPDKSASVPKSRDRRFMSSRQHVSELRRQMEAYRRKHGR